MIFTQVCDKFNGIYGLLRFQRIGQKFRVIWFELFINFIDF